MPRIRFFVPKAVVPILALFAGGALPATAADEMIPASLPPAQRDVLGKFLTKIKETKPEQFIPPDAKLQSATDVPVEIDTTPMKNAEVKEYLAEIIPHKVADKQKGPERADVYWFRPNPKRGSPGITVKRVVDLATGEQVGETIVLLNRPTPLTREEKEQAIQLARDKSDQVHGLYERGKDEDIAVTALFDQITVKGLPDGNPGDRVAHLQFRKKGTVEVISVDVNLTRETVREPK